MWIHVKDGDAARRDLYAPEQLHRQMQDQSADQQRNDRSREPHPQLRFRKQRGQPNEVGDQSQ